MWDRFYRDYPRDQPLVKKTIEPSHGLYGCEMHELNGWGDTLHRHRKREKSAPSTLVQRLRSLFQPKKDDSQ